MMSNPLSRWANQLRRRIYDVVILCPSCMEKRLSSLFLSKFSNGVNPADQHLGFWPLLPL